VGSNPTLSARSKKKATLGWLFFAPAARSEPSAWLTRGIRRAGRTCPALSESPICCAQSAQRGAPWARPCPTTSAVKRNRRHEKARAKRGAPRRKKLAQSAAPQDEKTHAKRGPRRTKIELKATWFIHFRRAATTSHARAQRSPTHNHSRAFSLHQRPFPQQNSPSKHRRPTAAERHR
jgi:hypothetical protein